MTNNNSSKKPVLLVFGGIILVAAAVFAFYFVDVDQTKEAMLPDVNVIVKEGQLPEFDVNTGSISMDTKAVEIDVPTTDVKMKTIEIQVPVDVDVGTEKSIIEVPTLNIEVPK
jgi:hypothetical protein